MKKTIKIDVTQECIDRGRPGRADACPIALAIMAAGKFSPFVSSFYTDFYSSEDDGYSVCFDLPEEANTFMSNFDLPDKRHLAKPFSFDLTYFE